MITLLSSVSCLRDILLPALHLGTTAERWGLGEKGMRIGKICMTTTQASFDAVVPVPVVL